MTESEIRALYGWAEIDPAAPIVAGSVGTWRITYHTGRYGVDDGGSLNLLGAMSAIGRTPIR